MGFVESFVDTRKNLSKVEERGNEGERGQIILSKADKGGATLILINSVILYQKENVTYRNAWKKIKKECVDNPEFVKTSRLLACLSFVPKENFEEVMYVIFERTKQGC